MAKRRNSSDSEEAVKTEPRDEDSSSSSDGEDEDWGRKSKSKKKKSGSGKRQRTDVKKDDEREEGEVDDDDDDEDDDADDEFNDGFDENLFGDEEDQKRLSMMTEKEREQELFNRSEKREVLRTRFEIERKLRLQKRAEKERLQRKAFSESSLRSNERRRDLEAKNVRRDALKGLKEQREKKKLKQQKLRASDVYSSSSSSDDEDGGRKAGSSSSSSSSSSSDDSDNDAGSRRRRNRDDDRNRSDDEEKDNYVVTLEDLNAIKITRSMIEKWLHAPFFVSTLTDAFTKVGIGAGRSGVPLYRICQIVEVTEGPAVYDIANTKTNKMLRLKHGKEERNFKLEYISNGPLVPNEFTAWKERMEGDNITLPDRKLVENKRRDIAVATNYRFTDQDIESMLKEKEKFNKTPKNFAMKKTQLLKQREQAEQMGDEGEVTRLQKELDELEEKAKELDKARTNSIAAISYINERNRARNIAEAEKAIVQETKEREQSAGDDPFRRRMCAPQLVAFKSGKKSIKTEPGVVVKVEPDSPVKEQVTSQSAPPVAAVVVKSEVKSEQAAPPALNPSDLFSAHNFEIDLNFDLVPGLPLSNSSSSSSASLSLSTNGTEADSKKFVPNRRSINLVEYKKKMNLI